MSAPEALALSPDGLAMIARFEGYWPRPQRLPDGRMVSGHGHVGDPDAARPLDPAAAKAQLLDDLAPAIAAVREAALVSLTPNQFDALVSFAHSVGVEAFLGSDVLRRLNAGSLIAAADGFDAWRRSPVQGASLPLDALVRRRAAEKALFLSEATPPGAPSAWVRPQVDHAWSLLGAPGEMASLPPLDPEADAERARLEAILAAEPATAQALRAPAPALEEPPAPPPPPPAPATAERDLLPLSALGVFGALLVALAGMSLRNPDGAWVVTALGGPGVLALMMAAFYLFRRSER